MATATMTTKGQVTIPLTIRNAMNLEVGSKIEFIETAAGEYKIVPLHQSVQVLKGVLKSKSAPVTIDEMNEAIAQMAVESQNKV